MSCGNIDYTVFFDLLAEEELRFCMVCGSEIKIAGESEIECGQ